MESEVAVMHEEDFDKLCIKAFGKPTQMRRREEVKRQERLNLEYSKTCTKLRNGTL